MPSFTIWNLFVGCHPMKKSRLNPFVLIYAVRIGAYRCWRSTKGRGLSWKWEWKTSQRAYGERIIGPRWNSCDGRQILLFLTFFHWSLRIITFFYWSPCWIFWWHALKYPDGEGASFTDGCPRKWLVGFWMGTLVAYLKLQRLKTLRSDPIFLFS